VIGDWPIRCHKLGLPTSIGTATPASHSHNNVTS
jgi:hypothetical protein